MSHYKLVFFGIRGRGEAPRLILHYAGQPFEDVRMELEKFREVKHCKFFGSKRKFYRIIFNFYGLI